MTTISVTAEHIANGTPGSSWGCAIVLAIRDAFPGVVDASAGEVTASLIIEDEYGAPLPGVDLDLPDAACDFVEAFDNEWDVEPFTFDLDYPAVTA
jgi:hypothetical protein